MKYGMLIDLNTCAGCASCVMACKQVNATPRGIYWSTLDFKEEGTYPTPKRRVLPHACMHCDAAPCVENCPSGATVKNENGIVTVDNEVCIGCLTCVEVCPYQARHYIEADPSETPYWGDGADLTPYELSKTTKRHKVATVGKCDMCLSRIEEGKEPMCVHTCITKCRVFGDLDDPNSEISKAIKELDAKPYRPELGTSPSVYYAGTY